MAALRTWNIYTDDGHYLGQAAALHPSIAFCQYKLTIGEVIHPADIAGKEKDEESFDLTYNGSKFRLSANYNAEMQKGTGVG